MTSYEQMRATRSALEKLIKVKGPGDIPRERHFYLRVFKTGSQYVEGDERSRTNPGHGYPAHTITYDDSAHYVTTDETLFREAYAALMQEDFNRTDVVGMVVEKRVEARVAVSVAVS